MAGVQCWIYLKAVVEERHARSMVIKYPSSAVKNSTERVFPGRTGGYRLRAERILESL